MYYVSWFWVRNWGAGLAGQLRISQEVAVRCLQGCSHLQSWLGLEDPLARWLTHMAGRLVLTSWFSSPEGYLNVLTIWWLASPRANESRLQCLKTEVTMPFILSLQKSHTVASAIFWYLHRPSLMFLDGRLHMSAGIRSQGPLGSLEAMVEAGYHTLHLLLWFPRWRLVSLALVSLFILGYSINLQLLSSLNPPSRLLLSEV